MPKTMMVMNAGMRALKLLAIISGTESGSLILMRSKRMRPLKIAMEMMPTKKARKSAEASRLPAMFSGSSTVMKLTDEIRPQMSGFWPSCSPME